LCGGESFAAACRGAGDGTAASITTGDATRQLIFVDCRRSISPGENLDPYEIIPPFKSGMNTILA